MGKKRKSSLLLMIVSCCRLLARSRAPFLTHTNNIQSPVPINFLHSVPRLLCGWIIIKILYALEAESG